MDKLRYDNKWLEQDPPLPDLDSLYFAQNQMDQQMSFSPTSIQQITSSNFHTSSPKIPITNSSCSGNEPLDDIGPKCDSPKGPNIIIAGSPLSIIQQAGNSCPLKLAFRPLKKLIKSAYDQEFSQSNLEAKLIFKKFEQILKKGNTITHLMRFFYLVSELNKIWSSLYPTLIGSYKDMRNNSERQKWELLRRILQQQGQVISGCHDLVQIWSLGKRKEKATYFSDCLISTMTNEECVAKNTRIRSLRTVDDNIYQQEQMVQKSRNYKRVVNRRDKFSQFEDKQNHLKEEAKSFVKKIRHLFPKNSK